MTQDRNNPNNTQTDQNVSEPVSNPNPSQYRPNWIIPDTDRSSNSSNKSNDKQRNQQDNANSKDSDETLGIP